MLNKVADKTTKWIGSFPSIVVHTILFIAIFGLRFFGVSLEDVLLILTTAVSLEAIYLAIFIQMTVNRQEESLRAVQEDVIELNEDVEDIAKDVDEISEDVEEIAKDVDEISEDVEDISEEIPKKKKPKKAIIKPNKKTILKITKPIKKKKA